MKKRNSNKRKFILFALILLFVIIIVSGVLFLWYALSGNYINIGNTSTEAENSTLEQAINSQVVIVNGIVLGASKDGKWVSSDKFYEANNSKAELEVDTYSQNGRYGTYKTASIRRHKNSVVYTTITKEMASANYIAISSKESANILPGMTRLEPTEEDKEYVKDAIGSYKLINGTVKISEVYATNINEVTDKIICATSERANLLGVYSAVVYVTGGKAHLVRYSYVRDTSDADRWPVYSLQYVMDLNADSKPEIVLQETTGNDTSYSVFELREKNEFYQVLKAVIEI